MEEEVDDLRTVTVVGDESVEEEIDTIGFLTTTTSSGVSTACDFRTPFSSLLESFVSHILANLEVLSLLTMLSSAAAGRQDDAMRINKSIKSVELRWVWMVVARRASGRRKGKYGR